MENFGGYCGTGQRRKGKTKKGEEEKEKTKRGKEVTRNAKSGSMYQTFDKKN